MRRAAHSIAPAAPKSHSAKAAEPKPAVQKPDRHSTARRSPAASGDSTDGHAALGREEDQLARTDRAIRMTIRTPMTMPTDLCRLMTPARAGVPRGAISSRRRPKAISASRSTPIPQCSQAATRS